MPPVAMAAFHLRGVAPPRVSRNQIFAGMMPFGHPGDRDPPALRVSRDRVMAAEYPLPVSRVA